MGKLIRGENDLATVNPELAKQWHPIKNGDLKPEDVSVGSNRKVWWLLPYDVPLDYSVEKLQGKHFDFEWEAPIAQRVKTGGCPYLTSNFGVWKGFNDLLTLRPDLAAQWHPTKNGELQPTQVRLNSNKSVWWLMPYDDERTGDHFDFEWSASIYSRVKESGCPFLSGQAVWQGFNDLVTINPELAKQWHPTKNGNLKPEDVTAGSGKKVWWLLPYDDSITGKHFDFEWQAIIKDRVSGKGCPYLSGHAVWTGFNDLAAVSPELAKQWHPIKNGNLKPEDVTVGNDKKIWWLLPYDDSETGKHFDFEWEASVVNRYKGASCPYLSGKAVWKGFNDLVTVNPELAKEWHPTKNGDLKPEDVTVGSSKKVWWLLSFDDSITGTHYDFEWQMKICDRTNGYGCPYLSGQAVWKGFNDLETVNPGLAKEWHPTKNGNLKPEDICAKSGNEVWWYLPYDDPETGKHFDFEWKAKVLNRVYGSGCPYLTGHAVWQGFNDLLTTYPELAKEWHPTKNGKLKPEDVTAGSSKNVWWLFPYDDSETGKHFDFEWKAVISSRVKGNGCPFLAGKDVWKGFNDLTTVSPELAKEWHPIKNGELTPEDVTVGSGKKVWWLLSYDDPKTGAHFDFEWRATVSNRTNGYGCPYLTGEDVWKGFNDLATINPELAKEWHPVKNGDLKPENVTSGSGMSVWWYLPYDDVKTGKHFDFEWREQICNRTSGYGCPYITGKSVWKGFNDLATVSPELAKEWHPNKNGNLKPEAVTAGNAKKVWWLLPYEDPKTGKHFDFEWRDSIAHRVYGRGCPFISGYAIWKGFNDLATINPELAKQWHPTRNGDLKPEDVTTGTDKKVWWLLPYDDAKTGKHFDFEWQAAIVHRVSGRGCPYLTGHAVLRGFNDLATTNPGLAKEWHPNKNGNLKPQDVTAGSNKKIWWLLPYDDPKTGKHFDFEWQAIIISRARGNGCPYLTVSKGEEYVKQYFKEKGIDYIYEQKFDDLKGIGNGLLSYDFQIKESGVLIEYHGLQHYKAVDYFGGDEQLKIQQEHDRRKRQYAKKHGYHLIEISYKYDTYELVTEKLDEELIKLSVITEKDRMTIKENMVQGKRHYIVEERFIWEVRGEKRLRYVSILDMWGHVYLYVTSESIADYVVNPIAVKSTLDEMDANDVYELGKDGWMLEKETVIEIEEYMNDNSEKGIEEYIRPYFGDGFINAYEKVLVGYKRDHC